MGKLRHAVSVGRVDYYHDPSAPEANSIVPSVTVAVRDEVGRMLLVHKIDNDFLGTARRSGGPGRIRD